MQSNFGLLFNIVIGWLFNIVNFGISPRNQYKTMDIIQVKTHLLDLHFDFMLIVPDW